MPDGQIRGDTMVRKIYLGVIGLLFVALLAQFYFAAVGAFDRPQDADSYAIHTTNGLVVIPALSVLATVVALLARVPARLVVMSILPAVLVAVQLLLGVLGGEDNDVTTGVGRAILGLHAINGLVTMGIAHMAFMQARALFTEAGADVLAGNEAPAGR
jgi:hypothetical protein